MAYRKPSPGGLSPATRITQEIIARLEAGTKPWVQARMKTCARRPSYSAAGCQRTLSCAAACSLILCGGSFMPKPK